MVQVVVMGIGAMVNALVFSGANSLFSMSTVAKRKKESDAKEKFQEALVAWNQRRAERAENRAARQKEISSAYRNIMHTIWMIIKVKILRTILLTKLF